MMVYNLSRDTSTETHSRYCGGIWRLCCAVGEESLQVSTVVLSHHLYPETFLSWSTQLLPRWQAEWYGNDGNCSKCYDLHRYPIFFFRPEQIQLASAMILQVFEMLLERWITKEQWSTVLCLYFLACSHLTCFISVTWEFAYWRPARQKSRGSSDSRVDRDLLSDWWQNFMLPWQKFARSHYIIRKIDF